MMKGLLISTLIFTMILQRQTYAQMPLASRLVRSSKLLLRQAPVRVPTGPVRPMPPIGIARGFRWSSHGNGGFSQFSSFLGAAGAAAGLYHVFHQDSDTCEEVRANVEEQVQVKKQEDQYYCEICFSGNASPKVSGNPGISLELEKIKARLTGIAGHGLYYIHGLAIDKENSSTLQRLKLATADDDHQGVGLSTNFNTKNAFVLTPSRELFFDGGLKGAYHKQSREQIVDHYIAQQFLKGVSYREEALPRYREGDKAGQPMDIHLRETQKILIKRGLGWDWGVSLARPLYCTRVPISSGELAQIKDYLNDLNEKVTQQSKGNQFSFISNNCAHPGVNVLAKIGILNGIPSSQCGQKGEMANPTVIPLDLLNVTNEISLDPEKIYHNKKWRERVLQNDELPTRPGTLLFHKPVYADNELYLPSSTYFWAPSFHHPTGQAPKFDIRVFAHNPYSTYLQRKEWTEKSENFKYHHQKIQTALAEVEKQRQRQSQTQEIASGDYQKFLTIYETLLNKKKRELEERMK